MPTSFLEEPIQQHVILGPVEAASEALPKRPGAVHTSELDVSWPFATTIVGTSVR